MATGIFTPGRVERIVHPGKVSLELSENEAQALRDLLGNVGGDPVQSRRKYVDTILNGLQECGIYRSGAEDKTGTIFFNNEVDVF